MIMNAIIPASFVAGLAITAIPAAHSGPYFNSEINSGFVGSDYTSSIVENHVGWEGSVDGGHVSYYLQGGPALLFGDGIDSELEFSGKAGGSVELAHDKLDLYGEVSVLSGDEDSSYGTKVGLKYKF